MIEKDGPRAVEIFESSSPRVQRQIEAYQEWQLEQLKMMAESDKIAQSYLQSKELVGKALHLLQDPSGKALAKEWLLEQNESLFKNHMQEFDRIGEKIANSEMAQSTDVSMKIVL